MAGNDWAVGGGAISALASYDSFATPGTNKNILQTDSNSIAAITVNTLKIATTSTSQSLALSGQLTLSGNGILFTGADAYSITGSSIRSNTGVTGDLIVHQNGAGDLSIDSNIVNGTGASGLTKTGSGTLVLNGTNSYTGTTSVRGGTLQVAASANLGSGSITLDAGTLRVTSAFDTSRALALGVNGGTVQLDSGTMTLSGVVSGGSYGALNKTGAGTLVLSGNNTYGGATNISAGTLRLGSATSLGASSTANNRSNSPVNVIGGTLDIDGFNAAIGNFTLASGNVTDTAGTGSLAAYAFTLQSGTVGAKMIDLVIAGSASNRTNLDKTTSGTVTLTGASTYSGTTTVSAGTLLVNGSLGSDSAVSVKGGTLGGTGTVGTTTILAGGTLAPGNSIGTMNFSQTLSLAGVSNFEIDPTLGLGLNSDLADVTGDLTYGGTLNVLYGGLASNFTTGMLFNLFDAASFGGIFDTINLPTLSGGLSWQNDLALNGTITVVPEPNVAILLGSLGMLCLLRRRER